MESRTKLRVAVVAAVALGVLSVAGPANVARADGGGDPGWLKETTDKGCYRLVADLVDSNSAQGQGFVWTGPCTPGQPISGEGTFYRQYRDGFIVGFVGRIVNGYPDGPTETLQFEIQGGALVPAGRGMPLTYRMGCPEIMGASCSPGSPMNVVTIPQVSPAHFPLPGGPSSFAESSAPTASSTTAATAPRRMSPSDRCVTMDDQSGTGHGWQVVNGCTYPVRVYWCYKDDGHFSCDAHKKGGTSRLEPGETEGVSASPRDGAGYRVGWCDDDDRDCRIPDPWLQP